MGFLYGESESALTLKSKATDSEGSFSATLTECKANTIYYYKAYATVRGTEDFYNETATFYGGVRSFSTRDLTGSATTSPATNIESNSAVAHGSYGVTDGICIEAGVYFGTSKDALVKYATKATSSPFAITLSNLQPSTQYYYQTYLITGTPDRSYTKEFTGEILDFKTVQQSQRPAGWLELPAAVSKTAISSTTTSSLSDLIQYTHFLDESTRVGKQRNYTFLYDPQMYASYWVAYPLTGSHMGSLKRPDPFPKDPAVSADKQTDIESGAYGVSVSTPNYSKNLYSRGHQLPNADRNGNATLQKQAFYATNITPQIQNGFNGGVWGNLEAEIRSAVPSSSSDSLYVVTGAAFKKVGGSETVKTITNSRDNKVLPIPNYYWKVILKVKWGAGGTITDACAVGFWLPHKDLKDEDYLDYRVSVDQIEAWTGFDFFANLPDILETSAEQNTNWTAFKNF